MFTNTRGSDKKQISSKGKVSSTISLHDSMKPDNFYNGNKKDVSPSYKNTQNTNIANSSLRIKSSSKDIRGNESYSQRTYIEKNRVNLKSSMTNNQGKYFKKYLIF